MASQASAPLELLESLRSLATTSFEDKENETKHLAGLEDLKQQSIQKRLDVKVIDMIDKNIDMTRAFINAHVKIYDLSSKCSSLSSLLLNVRAQGEEDAVARLSQEIWACFKEMQDIDLDMKGRDEDRARMHQELQECPRLSLTKTRLVDF